MSKQLNTEFAFKKNVSSTDIYLFVIKKLELELRRAGYFDGKQERHVTYEKLNKSIFISITIEETNDTTDTQKVNILHEIAD